MAMNSLRTGRKKAKKTRKQTKKAAPVQKTAIEAEIEAPVAETQHDTLTPATRVGYDPRVMGSQGPRQRDSRILTRMRMI